MIKSNVPSPKAKAKAARPAASALKRVSFAATLAGAREVLLTGDFTQWKAAVPLRKNPDGCWTAQLELAPGEYQYRLLVDGQWRDHAEAQRRIPNPFGTENCVLTVA
jgi:1,4-alpha-glucan branching enzyme